MKKFIALVMALVMALSLATVAWGTDFDLQAAIDAAQSGETITLTGNVTASSIITINKPITIDGANTYTLTSSAGRAINVATEGEVVIKNLTINASDERAINVITYPAELTIDNVTATAANYTVNVATSAGAAKVAIENSNLTGLQVVNVAGAGANITVTDSALTCKDQDTGTSNAFATLTLNKDATGAKITANGCTFNIDPNSDSCKAKSSAEGGVILVDGSAAEVKKEIAFISYGDYYAGFESIQGAIDYAVATGATKVQVSKDAINSGESFTPVTGVTVIMPADAEMVDDGTGNMTVAPAGTSGGAVATKFYVADDAAADDWKLLASFPGEDLDDFAKESSDNFLPCYEVPGYGFFTEVKAANGAYKLTYGAAKVVYLAPVDYTKVHFDAKASVLKVVDAEDAECGDWFVSALDEDDVYYATYDKKTGEVTEAFVATKNGPVQLLVGSKIVDVEPLVYGTDIEWKLHQFKGYDVVNKQYATVKCENCPKVAKLYANATAATIGKKEPVKLPNDLGWITYADFMDFGGKTSSVGSTTDKVQSAETFDAGIAMYVGMSVMAAAGSAVVIGKKKD